MIKLFIGLFFLTTMLQAASSETKCLNDLKAMSDAYYIGVKSEHLNKNDIAISYFKQSISSSYEAIQSCQNHPNYSSNEIYDYITSSEITINTIEEKEYLLY